MFINLHRSFQQSERRQNAVREMLLAAVQVQYSLILDTSSDHCAAVA